MEEIDFWFQIIRFGIGFVGTLTYFMCVKYNFLNVELDDPTKNLNATPNNLLALSFFCMIGGLVPVLMDIRLLFGCFIQGFILRATLSSFYSAAISKNTVLGGVER